MEFPSTLVGIFLVAAQSPSPGPVIHHDAIGCVVAEKFVQIEARFDPAEDVARARVNFRAEGRPHWYFTEMKPLDGRFVGTLPKPRKSIERINYYVEVVSRAFAASRTPEYSPQVVADAATCGTATLVASTAGSAIVAIVGPAGAPAVPAGFNAAGIATAGAGGGGLGTTALVVGGVAAAGAAVAAATLGGGEDETLGFVIEGTVQNDSSRNPGETFGGQFPPGPPVPGALVVTSLDAATATSDAAGHYRLVTQTPHSQCESNGIVFTVTVTAGGCDTFSITKQWGCGDPSNPPNPRALHIFNLSCR